MPNAKKLIRSLGWIVLGISLAVIYSTYVVAYTYYSPSGMLLVVALAILIIGLGTVEPYLRGSRSDFPVRSTTLRFGEAWINRHFATIFFITILAVAADVVLTLLGLSSFGLGIEKNKAVVALLSAGSIPMWLGLQFAPLGVAGSLYLIFKKTSVRVAVASYVLATTIYATYVAVNNAIVIARLAGLR